jgi:prolyl-tRNA synthetase
MRLSRYFFHTLKESPSDAEIESHRLLIRAGFIKKLAPGLYSLLPLGLRSVQKFETIVREEMNRAGAIEILMPVVHPQELWEETGRWEVMGKGLLKMKDRNGHGLCLGATHEEVVTDIVRKEIQSYRDMPVNLYQIQTKFRDEVRPRFGLMRGKEFIMKDAYSFDVNQEMALKSYEIMYNAYKRIFSRCGLKFRIVRADSGAIGGTHTHEFQVLAQSGEDQIMACENCDYASNVEITPAINNTGESKESQPSDNADEILLAAGYVKVENPFAIELNSKPGKKLPDLTEVTAKKLMGVKVVSTPHLKTIEDLSKALKIPASQLVKTLFLKISESKFACVLLRGDAELNEIKLKNLLQLSTPPEMANEGEVLKLTGAHPGSCGPKGLDVEIICDEGLRSIESWIVGANVDGYHLLDLKPEKDFKVHQWGDIRKAKDSDSCPECKTGILKSHRGIEVGHVFYLGDKYSKSMGATYLDEKGKSHYCEMGCYGIGIGRTVQAAIEQNHDKDGMVWPLSLAPFQVLICLLDVEDADTNSVAEKLYSDLQSEGVEVLLDDRNERPGSKFKDADLIGIPLRINVGKRSLSENRQVEIIERKSKTISKISADQVLTKIKVWISEEIRALSQL